MVDFSKPVELEFIFETIAVILVFTAIFTILVKKKATV
jgi:hypothetical protein